MPNPYKKLKEESEKTKRSPKLKGRKSSAEKTDKKQVKSWKKEGRQNAGHIPANKKPNTLKETKKKLQSFFSTKDQKQKPIKKIKFRKAPRNK